MRHEMKLHNEPFEQVKKGIKTVELRLYDMKRKALKVGDIIEFTNRLTNEIIDVLIIDLKKASDFTQAFEEYNHSAMGFLKNEESDVMLKNYTEAEIQKYGVIAIEFQLL